MGELKRPRQFAAVTRQVRDSDWQGMPRLHPRDRARRFSRRAGLVHAHKVCLRVLAAMSTDPRNLLSFLALVSILWDPNVPAQPAHAPEGGGGWRLVRRRCFERAVAQRMRSWAAGPEQRTHDQ